MVAFESIPYFDQYVVVAVVLFIIGLFSVMVYEKSSSSISSSSSSADKQKPKQRESKTNTR